MVKRKIKKVEKIIAPGYVKKTGPKGKETYYKTEGKEFKGGIGDKERTIFITKSRKGVDKEDVPMVPTFIPSEKTDEEKREQAIIGMVKRGMISGNKAVQLLKTKEIIETPDEKKGFLRKVAEVGLTPASFIGSQISKLTGQGDISTKELTEHITGHPAGRALGIATVGAAATLTGIGIAKAIFAIAPNLAKAQIAASSRATITATKTSIATGKGITIQRGFNVSTKTATSLAAQMAKMDQFTIKQIAKAGLSFALKHKAAVGAITGGQALATWYAVDNIATGASILSRDVATNVRFGNLSLEEGKEILDAAETDATFARRTAKVLVGSNPLLWPFYPIIARGSIVANRQIQFQKRILGIS